MFCPKCKSIISRKKINNQIVEFCNCPDKLESKYVTTIEPEKKRTKRETKITSEGKVITIKERSKKKFITIQEPIIKEKRLPSEYASLTIELRLSNNARLPSFWKQRQVQQRLSKQTEERYERYYRKIEDEFKGSELRFFISFLPNETLSDFNIDYWGLGFKTDVFQIFYAGTKLNDLASWDSKVLEKETDVILPYRLFTNYSRKLNFDLLSLRQLIDILKQDWIKFKNQHHDLNYQPISYTELYGNFKNTLFKKNE